MDVEMYKIDSNPFKFFDFDYIKTNNNGLNVGSRYRRYTIDLLSGKVSHNDTLSYETDSAGFPIINPKFAG